MVETERGIAAKPSESGGGCLDCPEPISGGEMKHVNELEVALGELQDVMDSEYGEESDFGGFEELDAYVTGDAIDPFEGADDVALLEAEFSRAEGDLEAFVRLNSDADLEEIKLEDAFLAEHELEDAALEMDLGNGATDLNALVAIAKAHPGLKVTLSF